MEKIPERKSVAEELDKILEEDQADRAVGHDNIDFKRMSENDRLRLARAREIYQEFKEGKLTLDGERLWKLAMLYQHSPNTDDYLVAMEVANLSAQAGNESGAWLSAAAEDRYLINTGRKQKWGTQFTRQAGEWKQMPMQSDEESGVTDEMRAQKHVPARDQQLAAFLADV